AHRGRAPRVPERPRRRRGRRGGTLSGALARRNRRRQRRRRALCGAGGAGGERREEDFLWSESSGGRPSLGAEGMEICFEGEEWKGGAERGVRGVDLQQSRFTIRLNFVGEHNAMNA